MIHTPLGIGLFIVAIVIAVAITSVSSWKNGEKSREEYNKLPADERPAHAMVDNSASLTSIVGAFIIIVLIMYVIVHFGL